MFQVLPFINLLTLVFGKTFNAHETFLKDLLKNIKIREVKSIEESDLIIAFIVVTSRAGTNIEAACKDIPETKPHVLVVLHHTLDINYLPPNSKRIVSDRENAFAVDCLFHEDQSLLICQQNTKAFEEVKKYLKSDHLLMKRQADVIPEQQGGPRYSSSDIGNDESDMEAGLLGGSRSRRPTTSARADEYLGRRSLSRFISCCHRSNVRSLYSSLLVVAGIFAVVIILCVIVEKLISAD